MDDGASLESSSGVHTIASAEWTTSNGAGSLLSINHTPCGLPLHGSATAAEERPAGNGTINSSRAAMVGDMALARPAEGVGWSSTTLAVNGSSTGAEGETTAGVNEVSDIDTAVGGGVEMVQPERLAGDGEQSLMSDEVVVLSNSQAQQQAQQRLFRERYSRRNRMATMAATVRASVAHVAAGGPVGRARRPLSDSTITSHAGASSTAPSTSTLEGPAVSGTSTSKEEKEMSSARAVKGKKRKRSTDSDEGGERCSICLDPWTSEGRHRICTLHCGHLFGLSCIERWLKERRSCPQCGGKVGPKNSNRVIPLFLANLVAKDTGELETARKLLEDEKRLRKQCEAERVRLAVHNESLKDQLRRLHKHHQQNLQQQQQQQQQQREVAPSLGPQQHQQHTAIPSSSSGEHQLLSTTTTPTLERRQSIPLRWTSRESNLPRAGTTDTPVSMGEKQGVSLGQCEGWNRTGGISRTTRSMVSVLSPPTRQSSPLAWTMSRGRADRSYLMYPNTPCKDVETLAPAVPEAVGEEEEEEESTGLQIRHQMVLGMELNSGRVAAFAGSAAADTLLVSRHFGQGSMGHGVTKVSLADLRHHKDVHLHKAQLRDIKFSGNAGTAGGCVLSTAFDKTLKVCDLRTDRVVVEYDLEGKGWSCQWSATDSNQMLCGIVDSRCAAVLLFDLRSTAGAVRKLRGAAGQRQPIHSICHTEDDQLLCATMCGVWALEGATNKSGRGAEGGVGGWAGKQRGNGDGEEAQQLQIQMGGCCSLSRSQMATTGMGGGSAREPSSRSHFLVSTRGEWGSHSVFGLDPAVMPAELPAPRSYDKAHNLHHKDNDTGIASSRGVGFMGSNNYQQSARRGDLMQDADDTQGGAHQASHEKNNASRKEPDLFSSRLPLETVVPNGGGADDEGREEGSRVGGSCDHRMVHDTLQPAPLALAEARSSWADRWKRCPAVAKGHESRRTLSRSLLWEPSLRAGLLIAGGDERSNQPWIWDAATGQVRSRLPANRGPVLDVAAAQTCSYTSGADLFAAVSQMEIRLYKMRITR